MPASFLVERPVTARVPVELSPPAGLEIEDIRALLKARRFAEAAEAARAARPNPPPPPVTPATNLYCDGDLPGAEKMIRAFLVEHGDQIEAMRLLARIGSDLEVYDDAELLLAAVLERAPDYAAAR